MPLKKESILKNHPGPGSHHNHFLIILVNIEMTLLVHGTAYLLVCHGY